MAVTHLVILVSLPYPLLAEHLINTN